MNKALKYFLSKTWQPMVSRYLSKTRVYRSGGLRLRIPKEVFHPGFFHSTKMLLKYLQGLDVRGKSLLELGAGSGLISFSMAQQGAIVTATDINPHAISFLEQNGKANGLPIRIIHSDLFRDIPPQDFDLIAINPPYYKRDPATAEEHAWYCGSKGQYFDRLFVEMGGYLHRDSQVLMVLSNECDLSMVRKLATAHHYSLETLREMKALGERLYIFRAIPDRIAE